MNALENDTCIDLQLAADPELSRKYVHTVVVVSAPTLGYMYKKFKLDHTKIDRRR